MTWLEVNELIEQIPIVSTMFNLKEMAGSFFDNFEHGKEFDEGITPEEHAERELREIQRQAILHGIKPPTRI